MTMTKARVTKAKASTRKATRLKIPEARGRYGPALDEARPSVGAAVGPRRVFEALLAGDLREGCAAVSTATAARSTVGIGGPFGAIAVTAPIDDLEDSVAHGVDGQAHLLGQERQRVHRHGEQHHARLVAVQALEAAQRRVRRRVGHVRRQGVARPRLRQQTAARAAGAAAHGDALRNAPLRRHLHQQSGIRR